MDVIWVHDLKLGDKIRFLTEQQVRTVTYIEPNRTKGRIYEPAFATRPIGFDGDRPSPVHKALKVMLIERVHRPPD